MGQADPGVIETRVAKGKNIASNSDAHKVANPNKIETPPRRQIDDAVSCYLKWLAKSIIDSDNWLTFKNIIIECFLFISITN